MPKVVNDYNRKKYKKRKRLPKFNISLCGRRTICKREFFDTYQDTEPYRLYLTNVRSTALVQLLSDHRKNYYCLYDMIDSGQIDDYGCLIPSAMQKLRPKRNYVPK